MANALEGDMDSRRAAHPSQTHAACRVPFALPDTHLDRVETRSAMIARSTIDLWQRRRMRRWLMEITVQTGMRCFDDGRVPDRARVGH